MDNYLIDTGLYGPKRTAAYLLLREGKATIFDTGARSSVPAILARMQELGVLPEDVTQIVLSHVHLDHAGGAGALMEVCPNATLIVHPRGARHMIDPSKLEASARQVYGDQAFEGIFGSLVPVPAERVRVVEDREEIGPFKFYDSPGHAYHHFVMHDRDTNELFAGDAFGLAYPEFAFAMPSTSPTQFDPEAALATYESIMALNPSRIAIAHFGYVQIELSRHHLMLKLGIEEHVSVAREFHEANLIETALLDRAPKECKSVLALDIHMNALGLAHWVTQAPR
ncbi:MAG: MBL fold metallo-hydrolase [Chthonomonas sp.]|nr:MBL fold metallo-hydrolase [Chthonomonas sp.]